MTAGPSLEKLALEIVHRNYYMCLATTDLSGRPWSSPVFFGVDDGCNFYCVSRPDSLHARNGAHNPRVSWSIYDGSLPPEQVDGVQFEGTWSECLTPDSVEHAISVVYQKRFPDPEERAKHGTDPGQFLGESAKRKWYRLEPSSMFKFDPASPGGDERLELSKSALIAHNGPARD